MEFSTLINWTIPFVGWYSSLLFKILIENFVSKQWNPDQTSRSATSDLGLHCLPLSHKKDAKLIWVESITNYEMDRNVG